MVFMHELGHNLGLTHGGDGANPYAPNFVSIMNPLYSTGTPIITTSTTSGSGYAYRIDYSDETLAPLNESDLNEAAGVGPTLHPNDLIFWSCPPPDCPALNGGFAPASGPIDWNLNGVATDNHVRVDLDNDGAYFVLTGSNDWAEVHQYLANENTHPKHALIATP
jgi:hypothetical protein